MYKAMAAYAAALIREPRMFIPVWDGQYGIAKDGADTFQLRTMHKISILGAMRGAQEMLVSDSRAYNALDKAVRHVAQERYGMDIKELNHEQAVIVLLTVARS